jgi:SOS response regulatory protein OraA/RecX
VKTGKATAPDPLTTAVRFLTYGDRSTKEVIEFLHGRGYSTSVIRVTRRTLERLGYLNDEQAARRLAQSQMQRRPMGRCALQAILSSRGFAERLVDLAVSEAYEGKTEEEVAARFLRSLPVRSADAMRETRRRAAALATRGFPQELIEPLLVSELSDQGAS